MLKKSLDYDVIGNSFCDKDCELQSIVLERKYQKNVLITLVYRPPQGNVVSFLEKLRLHLGKVYDGSEMQILIMGDFNIDYAKTKNSDTKKLLAFKNSFALEQVINKPTRFSTDTNSIIDLMFTNIKHIAIADVYNINMSDHLPTINL